MFCFKKLILKERHCFRSPPSPAILIFLIPPRVLLENKIFKWLMKLCRSSSSSIRADTGRPARNQILLFTRFWKLCKYSKLVQWDSNYLSHFWQRGPLIVVIFNFSEMKDSLKRGQIKLINSTKNAADFSFIFLVPFYFLINPMPCFSSAAAAAEDQETGESCDLIIRMFLYNHDEMADDECFK